MAGFTLMTEDETLKFTSPFGEAPPRTLGGGATIARVPIPKNKERTEWTGRTALQLQLSFKLDSFAAGKGVENERMIRILEKLWGMDTGSPEPPQLIVIGDPAGAIPHDYHDASHVRWWLEDIQEDDGTQRNSAGNRTRMAGTILLTEVVKDVTLERLSPGGKSKAKRYTVKKGDTLSKIASRYKIKGGWKTLAKLNNIRDPKRLKVGQKIRLS